MSAAAPHAGSQAHPAAALEAFRYQERARPRLTQLRDNNRKAVLPRDIRGAVRGREAQARGSGEGAGFHLNLEIIFKHVSESFHKGSWSASGDAGAMCCNHSSTQMVAWIKR